MLRGRRDRRARGGRRALARDARRAAAHARLRAARARCAARSATARGRALRNRLDVQDGARGIALFGQAAFGEGRARAAARGGPRDRRRLRAARGAGGPIRSRRRPRRAGCRCFRHARFRRQGAAIPERVAEHRALGAELNVLAVRDGDPAARDRRRAAARLALLPPVAAARASAAARRSRGRSSSARASRASRVFRPDAGVDTGPIVVQKGGVADRPTPTPRRASTSSKLYPLGVEAIVEAVDRDRRRDRAATRAQDEAARELPGPRRRRRRRASTGRGRRAELDRLIRGCDPQPGRPRARVGRRACGSSTRASSPAAPRARPPARVLGARRTAPGRGARRRSRVGRVRVGDGPKLAGARRRPAPRRPPRLSSSAAARAPGRAPPPQLPTAPKVPTFDLATWAPRERAERRSPSRAPPSGSTRGLPVRAEP